MQNSKSGSAIRQRDETRPLRVVFPFARHDHGGSTVSGGRLARELAVLGGVEPLIVSHSRGPAWRHLVREGLSVEVRDEGRSGSGLSFVTYEPRHKALEKLLRLTRTADAWLASNPVDVVHANEDMVAAAWGIAARRRNVPLVWHLRQPHGHTMFDRLLLRLASYVIFVADHNRGRFNSTAALPRNRTIYNGLDPQRYTSNIGAGAARRRIGLDDGLPVIGFVGNLVERKRPERAVEVSKQLHRAGLDHHLVMAGTDYTAGHYTDELLRRARRAGIERRFHLLGKRDDVPQLMRAFDVFLLCSTTEAFGLVVIEAMASGVPVVATAVDGVPEIVDHGRTGLLVDRDDVESMVEAATLLVTDSELAERLSRASCAAVAARFSIHRTAMDIAEIYAELTVDQGEG